MYGKQTFSVNVPIYTLFINYAVICGTTREGSAEFAAPEKYRIAKYIAIFGKYRGLHLYFAMNRNRTRKLKKNRQTDKQAGA